MTERYIRYQKRYRAYIINHTLRALFHSFLCLLGLAVCVTWFPVMKMRYNVTGIKQILIVIMVLVPCAVVVVGVFCMRDYWKEIAQLRAGKVAMETGTIVKKSKHNMYLMEFSVSDGNGKRKLSRSKRKKVSDKSATNNVIKKRHTVLNSYHIPRKNCEHDFRIGEQITIVYATTRILKENGIYAPLRMVGGVPMRLSDPGPGYYVIYAFAGDETETIPPIKFGKE